MAAPAWPHGPVRAALDDLPLSADALDRLAELRIARDAVDELIAAAIHECRTNAVTTFVDTVPDGTRQGTRSRPIPWAKIGETLGVSADTARRAYTRSQERR